MMEGRSGCAKCSETTKILKVEKTRASRAIQCLQLYKQLLLNYDTKHLNISRSQLETVVKKSGEENNALRQRLSFFIDSSNQLLAKQVETSVKVSDLERKLNEAENQSVLLEYHNKQLSQYFSVNEDNRDRFIDKIRKLARIVLKYDPENKGAIKALKMKFNFGPDFVQINRKVAQNYFVTKKDKLENEDMVPVGDSVRQMERRNTPQPPPPSGETSPLSVEEVECGIINEDSILSVSSDASNKGNYAVGMAERSVGSVRNHDGAMSERSDTSAENHIRVSDRSGSVDIVKSGRTSACSRLDLEFSSDSDLESSLSSENEDTPSDRADSPDAFLPEEELCSTAGSPRSVPPTDSNTCDSSIQSSDISSCQKSEKANLPNDRITDVISQSKLSSSENDSKSVVEKFTNSDQRSVTCSQFIFDSTSSSVIIREDKKHLERNESKSLVASETGRNSTETKEQQREKSSNSKLADENVNRGKSSQIVNNPLENSKEDIWNSCDQVQVVSDQSLFDDNVESCKQREGKQSPPDPMGEAEGSSVVKIYQHRELNTSTCLESSEEQNCVPQSSASSVGGSRSECGSKNLGAPSGSESWEGKLKHEVRSPANSCCGWGYSRLQNSSMLSPQFSRCCPNQPILINMAGRMDLRLKVTSSGDEVNVEVLQDDGKAADMSASSGASQDAGGDRRKGLTLTISSGVLDTPGCSPFPPPEPPLSKGYSIFETHRGSCFGETKVEDLPSHRRGLWYFTDCLLQNQLPQLPKFSVVSFLADSLSKNVSSRIFSENSWSYSETKLCDTFQKLNLRCDTSDIVVPEKAAKEQVGSQLFSQCTFHNRLATSSCHPPKMARLFGKSYEKEVYLEKNGYYSIFSQKCITPVFDKTFKSQFSSLQKISENQNSTLNKKKKLMNSAFGCYRNSPSLHCVDSLSTEPEDGRHFVDNASGGRCSVLRKARLKSSSLICPANDRIICKSSPGVGSLTDKEAPSADPLPPSSPVIRASSPGRRESCSLPASSSTSFKKHPGNTSEKSPAEPKTSSPLARVNPDNTSAKRESCHLLASPRASFKEHPEDTRRKSPAEPMSRANSDNSPEMGESCRFLASPSASFKERPEDTREKSPVESLVRANPDSSPKRRDSCRLLTSPSASFKEHPEDTREKSPVESLVRANPDSSPKRRDSCRLLASPSASFKEHPEDTRKKSPAESLVGANPDSSPKRRDSCRLLASPSTVSSPNRLSVPLLTDSEASTRVVKPRRIAHSKRLGSTGGGEARERSEEAAALQETQPGADSSSGILTLSGEPSSRDPSFNELTSREPFSREPPHREPSSREPPPREPSSRVPCPREPPLRVPCPRGSQVEGNKKQFLSPSRAVSSRVLRSSSTSASKLTGKPERNTCGKDRAVACSDGEDVFAVPATVKKRTRKRTECEGEIERICGSYLTQEPLVSPLKATPKKRTTTIEGGEDCSSKTDSMIPDFAEDIEAVEVTLLKVFQEYEYPACLSPLPVSMDESFCISSGSHEGIKRRKKRKNNPDKDTTTNRVKKRKLRSEVGDGKKEDILSIKETVHSTEISTGDENKDKNSISAISVKSSGKNIKGRSPSALSELSSCENERDNSSSVTSVKSSCENERDNSSSVTSVKSSCENERDNSSSVTSVKSSCENERDNSSSVTSVKSSCENEMDNSSLVMSVSSSGSKRDDLPGTKIFNCTSEPKTCIDERSVAKTVEHDHLEEHLGNTEIDMTSVSVSKMGGRSSLYVDAGFSCEENLNIHDTDDSYVNETSVAQDNSESQSEGNSELAEEESHENLFIMGENDSKNGGVHHYIIDNFDRIGKEDVIIKNVAEESPDVTHFNVADSKIEVVGAEDVLLASADVEDIGLYTSLRESSVDEHSSSITEETCKEADGESTAETSEQDGGTYLKLRKSANRKQYDRKGRTGCKTKTGERSDGRTGNMGEHQEASQNVVGGDLQDFRPTEDELQKANRNNLRPENSIGREDAEGDENISGATCESVNEKHSSQNITASDGYMKENTFYTSEGEVDSIIGNLNVKQEKKDFATSNSAEETQATTNENEELQIWEEEEDLGDPHEGGELLSIDTDTDNSEEESQSVTVNHNSDYTASLGGSSRYCDLTGLVSSEASCSETSAVASVSEDVEKVTPRFYLDRSVVPCDEGTSIPPRKSLNFYTEASQSENELENSKLPSEKVIPEPIVNNSCFRENSMEESRPNGISDEKGADSSSSDEERSTGVVERSGQTSSCTEPFPHVQHTAQSCTSDRLFRKRKNSDPHTSKQNSYKKLKMENYIECAEKNSFIIALQQFSKEIHSDTFVERGSTEKNDNSRIKKKVANFLQSTASDICPKLMLTLQELLEIPETNPILLTRSCIEVAYLQKKCDGGESGGGSAQERLPRDLRLLFMLITSYLAHVSTGASSSSPQLDQVLSTFEENISSFQDKSLTIKNLCRIVWLYTLICRLYRLDSRVRKTIYDIIYTRNMKAYPMVLRVLQSWPEVLPRKHQSRDCLLNRTVVLLLQSGSRKCALDAKTMSSFSMNALWNLLERRYGYTRDLALKDTLTQQILENIQNKTGAVSLVLLCRCEGWPWTKQLIDRQLVPRLRSWLDSKLDDNTAASIAVALGRILRAVPVTEASSTVRSILELLQTILLSSLDAEFCEQIVEAISLLRRHNMILCALIFIEWTPRAGFLTPNTLLHIRKVLAVKCLFHWKNFYLKYHCNEAKS